MIVRKNTHINASKSPVRIVKAGTDFLQWLVMRRSCRVNNTQKIFTGNLTRLFNLNERKIEKEVQKKSFTPPFAKCVFNDFVAD